MANEVQVQSGVALGMKIGCGLLLFFLVLTGGTCVACGACAAVGAGTTVAAVGKAEQDRKAKATVETEAYRDQVGLRVISIEKMSISDGWNVNFEVKNKGGSAIKELKAMIIGLGKDGGTVFAEEARAIIPFDPLAAGQSRKLSLTTNSPPADWSKKARAELLELELMPLDGGR